MNDKKLSVTQLGRSMETEAQDKNNIKRSDRYLGNPSVWRERFSIYKEISLSLIGRNNRPLIIVDWSHVPNTTCYILRAAFVTKGRALTLYEEVFPKRLENNPGVHRRFLQKIKKILLDMCIPIVITDAEFCKPWFNLVKEIGWDYVGRVRGNRCFRINIVALYFYRMEIEEGFRDLKSSQFGFSFEHAYSVKIRRIQVLLMIAMLAAYILFFSGGVPKSFNGTIDFKQILIKKGVYSPYSILVVAWSKKNYR